MCMCHLLLFVATSFNKNLGGRGGSSVGAVGTPAMDDEEKGERNEEEGEGKKREEEEMKVSTSFLWFLDLPMLGGTRPVIECLLRGVVCHRWITIMIIFNGCKIQVCMQMDCNM
ncbi:unnamed protein product [Urochloa humidicola]